MKIKLFLTIKIYLLFIILLNDKIFSETYLKTGKKNYKVKSFNIEIIDERNEKDNRLNIKIDKEELKKSINQDKVHLSKIENYDTSTDELHYPFLLEGGYYNKSKVKLPDNLDMYFEDILKNFIEDGTDDLNIKVYIIDAYQRISAGDMIIDSKVKAILRVEIINQNNEVLVNKKAESEKSNKTIAITSGILNGMLINALKDAFLNALL